MKKLLRETAQYYYIMLRVISRTITSVRSQIT